MKILFLISLLFIMSCNGGGGGSSQGTSPNVSTGGNAPQPGGNPPQDNGKEVFQVKMNESLETLPLELKITNEDKNIIQAEVELTPEEAEALNSLQ